MNMTATDNNKTRNNGEFNVVTFGGLRVAGEPTYTPAHINAAGKLVQARCTFAAYQTIKGKSCKFRFTAWGGMADAVARACCTGKEVTIVGEVRSYMGLVVQRDAQGNAHYVQNAQGQPLEIEKTGFEISTIKFGVDSRKTIDNEIRDGIRGPYWQVPGTQDELNWQEVRRRRNAEQFNPNAPKFGFAKVQMPRNGQIVDAKAYKASQQGGGNVGTAQFAGNPQAVGQVMNPNPAPQYQQSQQATQPVMVNGQNMGYPMQPQQSGFNSTPPNTPAPVQQAVANQAPPIYV